jgi:hypothetical protein
MSVKIITDDPRKPSTLRALPVAQACCDTCDARGPAVECRPDTARRGVAPDYEAMRLARTLVGWCYTVRPRGKNRRQRTVEHLLCRSCAAVRLAELEGRPVVGGVKVLAAWQKHEITTLRAYLAGADGACDAPCVGQVAKIGAVVRDRPDGASLAARMQEPITVGEGAEALEIAAWEVARDLQTCPRCGAEAGRMCEGKAVGDVEPVHRERLALELGRGPA